MPKATEEESNSGESSEKFFSVELAKSGRSTCKFCKSKIGSGELRIAKLLKNPFRSEPDSTDKMKYWYHVECLMSVFKNQRSTTKCITVPEKDIDGWSTIDEESQKTIQSALNKFEKTKKTGKTAAKSAEDDEGEVTAPPKKRGRPAKSK